MSLKLLEPFDHRGSTFKNRVGLAPLTRGRCSFPGGLTNDTVAEYYAQRASAGFILTEATGISRVGLGWFRAPGIYTEEQTAAWAKVVERVHAAGCNKFYCQLWHMGRQMHSDVSGQAPVSASAIPLTAPISTINGAKKDPETPHALTEEEIKETVKDYVNAATNAKKAGFDGVQIHCANGYLVDQFLQSVSNKRTDRYGGSVENRLNFLKEVVEGVLTVFPSEKVMVRFSPNGAFGEMGSADNVEQFDAAIKYCASKELEVVEVLDGLSFGFHEKCEAYTLRRARDIIRSVTTKTALMGNVGHTKESVEENLAKDNADLFSLGRPFIANPDLLEKFKSGGELKEAPFSDWWTHDEATLAEGYTTY